MFMNIAEDQEKNFILPETDTFDAVRVY